MVGERIKSLFTSNEGRLVEDSPLFNQERETKDNEEYIQKLRDQMDTAGGCCGAARAASELRDD